MADFTRLVDPNSGTWPQFPPGLDSWGVSGKGQFRTTLEVGRVWEEGYPPLRYNSSTTRAFLSYVNKLYRERTIFEIMHYHLQTPLGTISGSTTVNGASQTGTSITVTAITGTLKQGDIIKFAGLNLVYDITADRSNGATSLSIYPPIFSGGSPANGAAITYTGVKFRAVVTEVSMPKTEKGMWYEGLTLKFRECP